jgi:hypothetical protein
VETVGAVNFTVACALPAVALTPVGAVGAAAKTGFTAASTGAQRSIKIRVKVYRVIVGLGFSLIEYLQKSHENLSVSVGKSIAAEINKSSQVSSANTREFEKARGSVRKSESVTRLPSARIIRYDAINAQAS